VQPGITAAAKPPEPRNVSNPEMAATVAQLGPGTDLPPETPLPITGDVLARWQKLSDHADLLAKRRDPDSAIEVYQDAILEAERAAPPAPPAEVGRLYSKIGALEAGLGSLDEARASFESGRKLLQRARSNGKLDADGLQVLGEIEGRLRKLPRD
jgi:exonuclease VII small subunit